MPTSPVKTRIPLTSFGHLITEVKIWLMVCVVMGGLTCAPESNLALLGQRQLFGIEAPAAVDLIGWKKYFNSYTMQGRRNCVLATYGVLFCSVSAYWMYRQRKQEPPTPTV